MRNIVSEYIVIYFILYYYMYTCIQNKLGHFYSKDTHCNPFYRIDKLSVKFEVFFIL